MKATPALYLFLFVLPIYGFCQCENLVYVTNNGNGSGSITDPTNILDALSSAADGTIIYMAIGDYYISNAINNIPSGVTLEGGFNPDENWSKSSRPGATHIIRTALNPEGGVSAPRIVALYVDGSSDFHLQDLTITTTNMPTGTQGGISTYGVHLNSCSNYSFTRVQILPGNAGDGSIGATGTSGIDGNPGDPGHPGDGDNQCAGGSGGHGGYGGGFSSGTGGFYGFNTFPCDNIIETRTTGDSGGPSLIITSGSGGGGGGAGGEAEPVFRGGWGGAGGSLPLYSLGGEGGGVGECIGYSGSHGSAGGAGVKGSEGSGGSNEYSIGAQGFVLPGGTGASGGQGTGGKGGSGGGGGGGQEGCTFCCISGSGSGGGGGGGGGEGGYGGHGGWGGGGSIGVILVNNGSGGQFLDCTVQAGAPGQGGDGGPGGIGGAGGIGGTGSTYRGEDPGSPEVGAGGNGGNGGKGGDGGDGQPGTDGPAIDISKISGADLAVEQINFDLTVQPEITYELGANVNFSADYAAQWDFGVHAEPQLITGSDVNTQFTSAGRRDVQFDGNIYKGFITFYGQSCIIYVDSSATSGSNDGSCWFNAFTSLQDAIDLASMGGYCEIWVAQGTYYPSKDNDGNVPTGTDVRNTTFYLDFDIAIYGGFAGIELSLLEREWDMHPTILSGAMDDSYTVIHTKNSSSNLIIDGFTIQDGNADVTNFDNEPTSNGGGWYNEGALELSNPTIRNCIFKDNNAYFNGGAIFNNGAQGVASPLISNCEFRDNTSSAYGAGVYNYGVTIGNSNPTIEKSKFINNFATFGGGAIYNNGGSSGNSNPNITNTIFRQNRTGATGKGGGMYNDGFDGTCNPVISFCTFYSNTANDGGAIFNNGISGTCSPDISNSIFWSNGGTNKSIGNNTATPTLENCLIQEATCPSGTTCMSPGMILNMNPQFVNASAGNLAINGCSPALDAATSSIVTCDIEGLPRPINSVSDLGAYEFRFPLLGTITCYRDNDSDGFGDPSVSETLCAPCSENYVLDNTDCDDNDDSVFTGAPELCDGKDNDCNGIIDDDMQQNWYLDTDNDGYGIGAPLFVCLPPPNYALMNGDCDPDDDTVYPNAPEICDFQDNDCNGEIDEGHLKSKWYLDEDGDGRGGMSFVLLCGPPPGYVGNQMDCDDNDPDIYLNAVDICDGKDNDCDGITDENCCPFGNVIFVKSNAVGNNTGTSWTNAFTDLQVALSRECSSVTQIWVAEGTYKPTSGTDRNIAFVMKNDLAIYGGFEGNELSVVDRNWVTYKTILSGDIGNENDPSDNSYHVICNSLNDLNTSAVIDGFTIIEGNASGNLYETSSGGGMFNYYSSPAIVNCSFQGNFTAHTGAAVSNAYCSPVFSNNLFIGNFASDGGGAMVNAGGSPIITNSTFSHNTGVQLGGSIINFEAEPVLANCILWNNNSLDDLEISNLVESHPVVTYSIVKQSTGVHTGIGNLNIDPIFVRDPNPGLNGWDGMDDDFGDLRLQKCSPAINTGNTGSIMADFSDVNDDGDLTEPISIDYDQNDRIFFTYVEEVDMGAHEFSSIHQEVTPTPLQCYKDQDGDSYGNPAILKDFCESCGDGYVLDNTDCDDSNEDINPGASEICDDIDNNCSGLVDQDDPDLTDTEPPFVNCENITIQINNMGNAAINTSDIDDGSTDNCGIASYSLDINSFSCSDIGANTVTLTVTDNNGNINTCEATVTVEDNIDPTPMCKDITIQLDADGMATITPSQIDNGSNDICGIASSSLDITSFTCTDVGANTVTLTVTDNNGNINTCEATVTVEDNIDPTPMCKDVTIQLDADGMATITASQIDNGSNDICGIASSSLDITSFTCTDVGANTVILTVTDNNGNVNTCEATVTVEDNIDPTPMCNEITIQLHASGMATITASQIDNGSNDICGIASSSLDITSFTCTDVGANTVILTVTDNNGNVNTCEATVTVEDKIDPTPMCKDVTIQLDADGMATITPSQIDNGSNDACGIASTSLDITSFTCENVSANTVVLTVTDNNGNTSTCEATVTVEDNIDPTPLCQDITVQLNASGMATITTSQIDNGSNDVCGIASTSLDITSFSCEDIGPNTVVLTVTDNNGNTSTCEATVTVEDNIDPTPVCQDITVQLDASGNASITVTQIDYGSNDVCGIASTSLDITSFTCENVGANAVVLTVTDDNGNTSTCEATVTVEDHVDPTPVCQDITVQLDASGNASITVAQIDDGSNDVCGIASTSLDITSFTCEDVGANAVVLTVTDDNGNTSTCEATVTVEDHVDPTPVCQDITVQLDASGNASITVAQIDDGSNDVCGIASTSLDITSFTCEDVGANAVVLTVTDDNGNTSTCEATVTVEDNIDPTPVCQDIIVQLDASGNASITVAQIDDGSNDVCGIASTSLDITSFTCEDIGANTVVLTVTDDNGNTVTCEATVTVQDNIDPTPVCQDIIVQLDASGMATISASQFDNGSTDNCGIYEFIASQTIFSCSDIGSNTVSFSVEDVNGNIAVCEAEVLVEDISFENPHISGPLSFCPGLGGFTYSVPYNPNVSTYEWTYSNNNEVTISNNGSSQIIIDFTDNASAGILSVQLISGCGEPIAASSISLVIAPMSVCDLATCLETELYIDTELLSGPDLPQLFRVQGTISADAVVQGYLELISQEGIDLYPGFTVNGGDEFISKIEACTSGLRHSEADKK